VRARRLLLVLVALASRASAHVVPVDPSRCTFDPIAVDVPALGLSAVATAPAGGDALRLVYDVGTGRVQICPAASSDGAAECQPSLPVAFSLGSIAGSLQLPTLFGGALSSSGDLVIPGVPIFLQAGASSATVPVTFTTGLAVAGDAVIAGSPIAGLDHVELVGVVMAPLDPPLGGIPLVLRVACAPIPGPDVDQFTSPPRVVRLAGRLAPDRARLKATIDFPDPTRTLAAGPLLLRLVAGASTIATGSVSLAPQGKGLAGGDASGRWKVVATPRKHARWIVTLDVAGPTLPAIDGAGAIVGFTADLGNGIARSERRFRAAAHRTQLRAS